MAAITSGKAQRILLHPFDLYPARTILIVGLTGMLWTAGICAIGDLHLDGVLDIHGGSPAHLGTALFESIIDLFAMVLCVFIAGRIVTGRSVPVLSIIATQAFARLPFLLSTILVLLMLQNSALQDLITTFGGGRVPEAPGSMALVGAMLLGLLAVALLIWTIILMYRGYCKSYHINGNKAVISFILLLIAAEILSKVILVSVYSI